MSRLSKSLVVILLLFSLTCQAFATQSNISEIVQELITIDINSEEELLENAGLIGFASNTLQQMSPEEQKSANQEEVSTLIKYANELTRILYSSKTEVGKDWDTELDLSVGSGSGSANLNCIWLKEKTETEHFSRCLNHVGTATYNGIPHDKGRKDVQLHKKKLIGELPLCAGRNIPGYYICEDDCGWSQQLYNTPHVAPPNTPFLNDQIRHYILDCLNCDGFARGSDTQAGSIACTTNGIPWDKIPNVHNKGILACDICKRARSWPNCLIVGTTCVLCGFGPMREVSSYLDAADFVSNTSVTLVSTYYFDGNLKSINSVSQFQDWTPHKQYSAGKTTFKIIDANTFQSSTVVTVKDRNKPLTGIPLLYGNINIKTTDGKDYQLNHYKHVGKVIGGLPVSTKPAVITKTGIKDDWATGLTVQPTFKSPLASKIEFAVFDATGVTQLTPWSIGTPTGNLFEFTTVLNPLISAGANKTFRIYAKDSLEGLAYEEFTIEKTDAQAPIIKTNVDLTNPWSKFKMLKVQVEDESSGNIHISFNDENNYEPTTVNTQGEFERTYKLIGDVYTKQSRPFFVKDALGNITVYTVEIDKIDNTSPTISDVTNLTMDNYTKSHLTVMSIDEGSGINKYSISESDSATDWQTSNSFIVTKSNTYNLFTQDLVGNISTPFSKLIDIDRPTKPNVRTIQKILR